jgi:putative FmdB family regulatory protein
MPLYEYHCESCERDFEKRRAIHEANEPIQCPECESAQVTRKLSHFIALGKSDVGTQASGASGCACGGACSCGRHSMN